MCLCCCWRSSLFFFSRWFWSVLFGFCAAACASLQGVQMGPSSVHLKGWRCLRGAASNSHKFAGPWANGVLDPEQVSICQNLSHFPGEVYLPLPLPRDPGAPKVQPSMRVMGPFGHFFSTLFPSTFSTHFGEPKSTPPGLKNDPLEASKSTFWWSNG